MSALDKLRIICFAANGDQIEMIDPKDLKQWLESPELLEKLADLEHKQWSYWIGYLLSLSQKSLLQKLNTSWYELARTPYSKLSDAKKESDREFAKMVLKGLLEDSK